MRTPNYRVAATGTGLTLLAALFFLWMWSLAARSNDPSAMMQTVGTVSGAAVGLGVAMIVFGLIGRRQARR